jgi:hypothetical protein
LVAEYETNKKEWQEWKARREKGGGGRRGRGNPSRRGPGRARHRDAPQLQPVLNRIADLDTSASVKFLAREYRDQDPEIAVMCALALLRSERPNAAKTIVRGFDPHRAWSPGLKARVFDALAQSGHEEAVAFVIRMASKGRVAMRALAITSLQFLPQDDKARTVLLRALGHDSYAVRSAALRAIAAFRNKEVIAELIGRLGNEENERLRVDVLRALVRLTGKNMGLVDTDWRKWWEASAQAFAFDKKSSQRTVSVTPGLKYFGIEVASRRVAFLVDASRSMDGGGNRGGRRGRGRRRPGGGARDEGGPGGTTKLQAMKTELSRILTQMPDDSLINVIYFHRSPIPWKKRLHPLKGQGREEAVQFVEGLTTELRTNIYDTLELALEDKRVDTIFLLTDGMAVGGKYTDPDDILREIGGINRIRGATIHCISFGRPMSWLKDLAAQNGGDYRAIDR